LDIPSLHHLLETKSFSQLSMESLLLLEWIINPKYFELKQIRFEDFLKEKNGQFKMSTHSKKPKHIFQVTYKTLELNNFDNNSFENLSPLLSKRERINQNERISPNASPSPIHSPSVRSSPLLNRNGNNLSGNNLEAFEKLKSEWGTTYGYHGSPLENFYSILNFGLQKKFSKTGIFGEGLYLAKDNQVSENFLTVGDVWKNSVFENKIACMVGCEAVNNPEKLRTAEGKYLIAESDELVQIKHLLVFEGSPRSNQNSSSFLRRNFLLILFVLYILVLLFVRFRSSRSFRYYLF